VRLKTNKIVVPRQSQRTSKDREVKYGDLDPTSRYLSGETITGSIQKYRFWWRYLKLCLELEEEKILVKGQRIRVSRRFYRDWDLDEVWDRSFDKWWRSHRHLFVEEQIRVLSESEDLDSEYVYLKIPRSRREIDIVRELKPQLKSRLKERSIQYPFSTKPMPLIRLHIQYNCLVMSINGKSGIEIMNWCNGKYGNISGVIQKKNDEMGVPIEAVFNGDPQSVYRVISKGRDTLISTSKGNFP